MMCSKPKTPTKKNRLKNYKSTQPRKTQFLTEIDKQLKDMQEVTLDYVTEILENMAATERENSLNRKDNNGDTFLHRLIRSSNINDTISIEEFTDRYQESYH